MSVKFTFLDPTQCNRSVKTLPTVDPHMITFVINTYSPDVSLSG